LIPTREIGYVTLFCALAFDIPIRSLRVLFNLPRRKFWELWALMRADGRIRLAHSAVHIIPVVRRRWHLSLSTTIEPKSHPYQT
jgi:hypothetical protein